MVLTNDKEFDGADNNGTLRRNYKNLLIKFIRYLIPTMVTTMALSLNEFVDSMIVANLLSSEAMGIVNLGFPVMLIMAAIYTLFGVGRSTLYSIFLGERQTQKAGKILCLSLAAARPDLFGSAAL